MVFETERAAVGSCRYKHGKAVADMLDSSVIGKTRLHKQQQKKKRISAEHKVIIAKFLRPFCNNRCMGQYYKVTIHLFTL